MPVLAETLHNHSTALRHFLAAQRATVVHCGGVEIRLRPVSSSLCARFLRFSERLRERWPLFSVHRWHLQSPQDLGKSSDFLLTSFDESQAGKKNPDKDEKDSSAGVCLRVLIQSWPLHHYIKLMPLAIHFASPYTHTSNGFDPQFLKKLKKKKELTWLKDNKQWVTCWMRQLDLCFSDCTI